VGVAPSDGLDVGSAVRGSSNDVAKARDSGFEPEACITNSHNCEGYRVDEFVRHPDAVQVVVVGSVVDVDPTALGCGKDLLAFLNANEQ